MMQYLTAFNLLPMAWQQLLQNQLSQLSKIDHYLHQNAGTVTIYPGREQIFAALQHTAPNRVKLLIIGQDPYHGPGQATGLAFAVDDDLRPLPPSLYNIYEEILLNNLPLDHLEKPAQDLIVRFKAANSRDRKQIMNGLHHRMINRWPQQGVLLLNTSLTVIANQANSLQNIGWLEITSNIIQQVSIHNQRCVFMLWGTHARSLQPFIKQQSQHLILTAAHPSPLSAHKGFFGCQHFLKANEFLIKNNITPIKWIIN